MKIKKSTLLRIAGSTWFIIGVFLMYKGVHYFMENPTLTFAGIENGVILLMTAALLLGFLKGRRVLTKVVDREASRINCLITSPTLFDLYSRRQFFLILAMILLGMSLRLFSLDPLIRGFIDVTIGSALIHGSMHYYKLSISSPATCDSPNL